jgi:hypothetical protein
MNGRAIHAEDSMLSGNKPANSVDRDDAVDKFYRLFMSAKGLLLFKGNLTGITGDKADFVERLLFQLFIVWYLQEKGFLDGKKNYLTDWFRELDRTTYTSYFDFLKAIFVKMEGAITNSARYQNPDLGNITVIGSAPFVIHDYNNVQVNDAVFYQEGLTEVLRHIDPSKALHVPILNLLESMDWTDGNADTYLLGAVYEKLMTADTRKAHGSYYTPEVITKYMSRQVIERWILSQMDCEGKQRHGSIEEIVAKSGREMCLDLFGKLKGIRIVDPAAGSGHFLEAAMDVLAGLHETIWRRLKELGVSEGLSLETGDDLGDVSTVELMDIDGADVSRFRACIRFYLILPKNLYGVDINPSVIEIARARLFLSLSKQVDGMSDTTPVGLSRARFNLSAGNSLIGLVDLPRGDQDAKSLDALYVERNTHISMEDLQMTSRLHWGLEFPEIFAGGTAPGRNRDRKGFDIVLGNPPYVRADSDDETTVLQRSIIAWSSEYSLLFEKWDLYVAFIERAIKSLLNDHGMLCFIVSDAVCTVKYAEKLRQFLARECHVSRLDYFEGYDVFPGISVVPVVLFLEKAGPWLTEKVVHRGRFDTIVKLGIFPQADASIFRKTNSSIKYPEFTDCELLGKICYISKGMVLNADEKRYPGEFKAEDLIFLENTGDCTMPFIDGKDCTRFAVFSIRFLEWGTDRCPAKISRKTFPELYVKEKIIKGRMNDGVVDRIGLLTSANAMVLKRFIDLRGIFNRSIAGSLKKSNPHAVSRTELEERSAAFSYEYILCVLNSTLARAYLNSIRRHKQPDYFYPDDLKRLPIKRLADQSTFIRLEHVLEFLHGCKANAAGGLDRVLDALVHELYFLPELVKDGVYPDNTYFLAKKIGKKMDFSFDFEEWNELHLQHLLGSLKGNQEGHLNEIEHTALSIVQADVDEIENDDEIRDLVEKIESHMLPRF